MTKLFKLTGGIFVVFSTFFYSCGDTELLELGKLSGVENAEPFFSLPVAHGNYTVWDLVNQVDNEMIQLDGDDIVIRYQKDSIYFLNVDEMIDISNTHVDEELKIELPSILQGVALLNKVDLDKQAAIKIDFEDATISRFEGDMKIVCTFPVQSFEYTISCTFENIKHDGQALVISNAENNVETLDLENVVMDMASANDSIRYTLELEIPAGQTIDNIDELAIRIQIDNLEFKKLVGKITPKDFVIPNDQFSLGLTFWDNFSGKFGFAAPNLELIVENYGLRVPFEVEMNLKAYNADESRAFSPDENLRFNGWQGTDVAVVERQGYNDSDFADMLSLPPKDSITFGGKVMVNPDNNAEVTLLSTGRIAVGLDLKIPLELSLDKIQFIDTIDLDAGEVDILKAVSLDIVAENGIPLALSAGNFYILDANYNLLDSITVNNFLDAPKVDANGDVLDNIQSSHRVELTEKNIEHLKDAKYMALSIAASTSRTSENKLIPSKFKKYSPLSLQLRLNVKVKLDDL